MNEQPHVPCAPANSQPLSPGDIEQSPKRFSRFLPAEDRTSTGREVTLVIPGRNCASTIRACLESVIPLIASNELSRIIFVDDGSTDETAKIVSTYPVTLIRGEGRGPGHARNLGWRTATSPLIWFIDSDCVAEHDALSLLLPHLADPEVAGVGGSYGNLYPESLLATLIHEEIIVRHRRMPTDVNFLGGFNVLYRRSVLKELDGYDESATNGPGEAGAEDCDLSFRAVQMGHRLRFELGSRVGHHHPRRNWGYLKTQLRHGRFRVALFLRHRDKVQGDSYAGAMDYVQPPLAMMSLAAIPMLAIPVWGVLAPASLICLVLVAQLPMARAMAKSSWRLSLAYIPFGFVRAYARGLGMTLGVASLVGSTRRSSSSAASSPTSEPRAEQLTVSR